MLGFGGVHPASGQQKLHGNVIGDSPPQLDGPASASTPTLISGRANFACSSMTMMSVPSTTSKPPPQAMPLTAAMIGLLRLRG